MEKLLSMLNPIPLVALSLASLTLVSCDKIGEIAEKAKDAASDAVSSGSEADPDAPKQRRVGLSAVKSGGKEMVEKWKGEPNVLLIVDYYADW